MHELWLKNEDGVTELLVQFGDAIKQIFTNEVTKTIIYIIF